MVEDTDCGSTLQMNLEHFAEGSIGGSFPML